jgi:4-hydroxy-tetrahydrodipicolinate synthase
MNTSHNMSGVLAPVVTPFRADLQVDPDRFSSFCRWLVGQGAGLAIFGTNSEGNSLSLKERLELLDRLLEDGIDPKRMMPGTGCCSLPETVELTRHVVRRGCGGALMLPPFFYKGVSDDGLFAYYSQVIQGVGSDGLRLYLYHIPQVSGVAITHALVERLIKAYPQTVVGIKDSSGDWSNTEAMLHRFPGFSVFPASEALLGKALPLGAAGCISATANIQPAGIADLIRQFGSSGDEGRQRQVSAVRMLLQAAPMIPALKYVISKCASDDAWRTVRPPLTPLAAETGDELMGKLSQLGFAMSGLGQEIA